MKNILKMVSWELVFRASVFIAEEMGVALRRSAFSPNIRERMDHSCAITDSEGNIVAQAEHIPVHLGSFRVGVKNYLIGLVGRVLSLDLVMLCYSMTRTYQVRI